MYKWFRKCLMLAVLTALSVTSASALPITYQFDFNIAGGSLDGVAASGQYAFESSLLTGTGSEYLPLLNFSFPFSGYSFSLADFSSATADFFDGSLLGVTYSASSAIPDQSVSFQSGFFDLSEQTFAYSMAGVPQGGAGEPGNEITTTQFQVPEPGTLWYAPFFAAVLRWRPRSAISAKKFTDTPLGLCFLGLVAYRMALIAGLVGIWIGSDGCGSNSYHQVVVNEEFNPNNQSVYSPPVTYSGISPLYLPSNEDETMLFNLVGDTSISDFIGFNGCGGKTEYPAGGVACTWNVKINDGDQITDNLYPIFRKQPVLINDTPFEVIARDRNGQKLQTIAPGTTTVSLAYGAETLEYPSFARNAKIEWVDPVKGTDNDIGLNFYL